MIRSADERLADYLSRLDRTDAEEDGASGRRVKNLTEKIAALKERKTRLKLTRFRGHPNVGIFGVHDGKEAGAVCAGVPPADD